LSGSFTRPKFEKTEEQLGQRKTSGLLFHTFPSVPHIGHFPENIRFALLLVTEKLAAPTSGLH
jgi:hypothetical protein